MSYLLIPLSHNAIMKVQRWHHAAHLFVPNSFYMITARTIDARHFFKDDKSLDLLQECNFSALESYQWEPQAWAIFSNHYHLIFSCTEASVPIDITMNRIHSSSSRELNRQDNTPGRRVWFQYWDTCLTYEKSLLARLNYVHNNPVKHGLVKMAEAYPWCSAA